MNSYGLDKDAEIKKALAVPSNISRQRKSKKIAKSVGDIRLTGERFVWLLTVAIIVCFQALEPYSWGVIVMAMLACLIFAIDILSNKQKIELCFGKYHGLMLAFGLYCLLSSIWAWQPSDAIEKGTTIIELFVFMTIIYAYYAKGRPVRNLISALMWAGYILSLYAIISYGPSYILNTIASGARLENSYSNINTVSMSAAMTIIIAVYFALAERPRANLILTIPCLLMVAAGGSRKALVMVVLGVAIIVLKEIPKRKFTTAAGVTVIVILAAALIAIIARETGLFDGSLSRLDGLIALLSGEGKVDHSAWMRSQMTILGLKQFRETPLLGIGMGCSHIIAATQLSFDAYLHNNYVELLSGGGLVGFAIYYSMFLIPLYGIWMRKDNDNMAVLVVVMLVVLLIMDMGAVTYYGKITYVYLMIAFLYLDSTKRDSCLSVCRGINERTV